MKELVTYILNELKADRISRSEAVRLLKQAATNPSANDTELLHPLIHRNISTLEGQVFESVFRGTEFFLTDHVAAGRKILPGTVYLEMARAALVLSTGVAEETVALSRVSWQQPMDVSEGAIRVYTALQVQEDENVFFEIYSEEEGVKTIYSNGWATLTGCKDTAVPDVAASADEMPLLLQGTACYQLFEEAGMVYGPTFKAIQQIRGNGQQVFVDLVLPEALQASVTDYLLHPVILDAALQGSVGLTIGDAMMKSKAPFALEALKVYRPCTTHMQAVITHSKTYKGDSNIQQLDIQLNDLHGNVCVLLKGFTFRLLDMGTNEQLLLLEKKEQPFIAANALVSTAYERHVILLCGDAVSFAGVIQEVFDKSSVLTVTAGSDMLPDNFMSYAERLFIEIKDLLEVRVTGKSLLQVVMSGAERTLLAGGLTGMLQTAVLEYPLLDAKLIETDETGTALAAVLKQHMGAGPLYVKYRDGKGWQDSWEPLSVSQDAMPWKDQGVYLITGGAGGLGQLFAREILSRTKNAVVILAGRRALDNDIAAILEALNSETGKVVYRQLDLGDAASVNTHIQEIISLYGGLQGVIHSAGLTKDAYITKKEIADFRDVLLPKVTGTVHLENACRDIALDFFILFSSGSGVTGNAGQADYATANAFLDAFTRERSTFVAQRKINVRYLSINWPLWEAGGMDISREARQLLRQTTGMTPMSTANGLQAFYTAWASRKTQVLVMQGDPQKLQAFFRQSEKRTEKPQTTSQKTIVSVNNDVDIQAAALTYFSRQLADFVKLPYHEIESDVTLDKYGIESILMMQLVSHFEKQFGPLPRTLFFEYQTIAELTGYFIAEHNAQLQTILGVGRKEREEKVPTPVERPAVRMKEKKPLKIAPVKAINPASDQNKEAIAIIAIEGRYPQSANIAAFWDKLRTGKDCITTVPTERWDNSLYFEQQPAAPGKTYCNWGGFIPAADQFDPLFFNISPREASLTDPQERLFLETVWQLLESAGYTKDTLKRKYNSEVGVFAGAMYNHYQLLGGGDAQEAVTALSSHSAIANRVSYYFNLHGPSLAVDTACSSSLVALHYACESILKGECQMAIAGGVNVTVHPKKYTGLSLTGMIASHPDSRSFSAGDGYLPADGVGAVLLKPLSAAIADNDNILAVVLSTAISHNGQSNGFTVPNLAAQAQLIEQHFRHAGIDPATISYVEAAANGSAMGDAIEFAALSRAFRKFSDQQGFCAIGAVKSNIGHAEAASGMSQLSKVVLQLHHRQLVPTLRKGASNPDISWEGSPFYLQDHLADWDRPFPLRATVSSFGAGGTNVHVILEEFRHEVIEDTTNNGTFIIPLSARSSRELQRMKHALSAFLDTTADVSLENMAHTLQTGREAMPYRWVAVVKDIAALKTALQDSPEIPADIPVYNGEPGDTDATIKRILSGSSQQVLLETAAQEQNYDLLALYWAKGASLNWSDLALYPAARKMVLPGYPFEQRRCWIENTATPHPVVSKPVQTNGINGQTKELSDLIAAILGVAKADLDKDQPLEAYGMDSMQMMQVVQQLQLHYNPAIHPGQLVACRTINDISAVLEEVGGIAPVPADWSAFPELVRLNGKQEGRPVFWFHAAAGGVEPYQALAQTIERPFYGLQARGYMTERQPLKGVSAMAAYYIHIIRSVQATGPYDLGGYSLGGVIAYEVARQLQEMGQQVNTIVMLDSLYGAEVSAERFDKRDAILQAVNMSLFSGIVNSPERFKEILINRSLVADITDTDALISTLMEHFKERGGTQPVARLEEFIRQSVRVQEAYVVDQYEVSPLPDPTGLHCHYFRNGNGYFLGELAPFFMLSKEQPAYDHINYWAEWEQQIPDFEITDLDVANHMMLLSDETAYHIITDYCRKIYAAEGANASTAAGSTIKRRPLLLEEKIAVTENES
ncbi:SDR family NAD(P)-dependent oxidoreductase [Chitinophaga pinensis]|uniref:KR domain protein n=1 Tax=Chitinophaga pinensis (strain ATCC 43595 / DSM 2588 / LMG 13176 / NBRC 15968 / NCIMB 11800 / UQM 2034) TaxID=485918 RepID=A0A979GZP7_CHIPD|nr:SDR family NAD(P)-dependent oxidoreductase [Chitinophaga pinensis]ACU62720.1 KR domain protein [Chitinophaga pinensis DSM 2588]